ncbi:hypothetical protein G5V58_22400 [Nocardioides anomalus]|uniref:Uncharacterized protein n=1 Tax=Nocardioides anomalus TaxID=2712223 RepID=A0A6G6WIW6_9ACTN|nr:hypothetical protein [Nocardioides anomalus]QIG45146.1 hypothetical protein G5V58_22400 [Nocardioides anomalus]
MRDRFRGQIAGVGSTSGTRVVVGRWTDTPLGTFADAMVETADGHRVLLAPQPEVAQFIEATYTFDEVRLEPFAITASETHWEVRSTSLGLDLRLGKRGWLGIALLAVPPPLAEAPAWCTLTDPVARVVLRGVRTRGTAGGGRREYYGATDTRSVVSLHGAFDGADLGGLADVDPPARFGFSSTPRSPSVTSVVTTVVS